jgi:hypothetical protein
MSIQLSSNSNEALRLVIQGKPTLVGQYRQAYLQYTDRVTALKTCEFNLRTVDAKIRLKEVEKRQLLELIEQEENLNQIEAYKINIELFEIQIEELMYQTQQFHLQIKDAEREALLCQELMASICKEADVDFGSISTQEFQHYMLEETRQFQARKIAASLLSSTTGLPNLVTEALLELPEKDRLDMLNRQQDILNKHNKLILESNTKPNDLKLQSKSSFNKSLELVDSPLKFIN